MTNVFDIKTGKPVGKRGLTLATLVHEWGLPITVRATQNDTRNPEVYPTGTVLLLETPASFDTRAGDFVYAPHMRTHGVRANNPRWERIK